MSTLYERIKHYCDIANISGAKLCSDVGISKSTLTSLKQGRTKKISTDNLTKIAERLGVSVDVLLGSEQKEKSPMSEDTGLNSEFINLFNQLSPEDQAREIAYLRERVSGQDK